VADLLRPDKADRRQREEDRRGREESRELKTELATRAAASEHLKLIHALITEWSQNAVRDRRHAFVAQMASRSEVHVITELEGPLPQCLELANTASPIMPDDVSGLAEPAIAEVEAAQVRVWKGHTVELS